MMYLIFISLFFTYSSAAPEKGIGLAWRDCNDAANLNVGWMYTWQPWHPCPGKANFNVPWIPMIFDSSQLHYLNSLNGQYEALLGFNEPDASNQGNMSPQQALNAWPQMQSWAIKKGVRLGSPATTEQEAFGWMKTFMQGVWAKGYKVDFLCFHFYFNRWLTEFDEFNDLRTFLNKIKAHYPGYKIWITEIAWRHGDADTNYKTMLAVYDMLRKEYSDIVERWAWFTNRWRLEDGTYSSNGWDLQYWDASLTPLGKLYRWLPIYGPSAMEEEAEETVDDTSIHWTTWFAVSLLSVLLLCCLVGVGICWRRRKGKKNISKGLEKEGGSGHDQIELEEKEKETGYDMSPIDTNESNKDESQIGDGSVDNELDEIDIDVEMNVEQDVDDGVTATTTTQD